MKTIKINADKATRMAAHLNMMEGLLAAVAMMVGIDTIAAIGASLPEAPRMAELYADHGRGTGAQREATELIEALESDEDEVTL